MALYTTKLIMVTTLALATSQNDPLLTLDRILARNGLAKTTGYRYRREVEVATAAGVNLWDREALADYAAALPTSRKAFLKAAVRLLANELTDQAQAAATPDNVAMVQAIVYRAISVKRAITVKAARGQAAHTWLTPLEVKMLLSLPDLATVKGRRDRIALALLVGAGLRRSEAAVLTWANVVRQGGRVVLAITGKGKKRRSVPINPKMATWLTDWQTETAGGAADNVVSSVTRGGQLNGGLSGQGILSIVSRYGRLLDKPDLRPHDLRRTYARIGYDAKVDIGQISLLLGHSSIAITQTYLGLQIDTNKSVSDYVPM